MVRELEISMLDLRYERYRMRNFALESRLLTSIAEKGIDEPLEGIDIQGVHILLNGFKRYRCVQKLHIGMVPYISLANDEAMGILALLRISNTKSLTILEQARFIDELKNIHNMNVTQIAEHLHRSKSWVSMRLGLISEMTDIIREKLFSGAFPVYPYMYALRQFMRMNNIKKSDIEEFVVALSGKNLSVRQIEQLAHGFFRGPPLFKAQILNGNIALPLNQMQKIEDTISECNEFERVLLKDLEITQKYMQRVLGKSYNDKRLSSSAFYAQANLLTSGILHQSNAFYQTLRQLHDRSRQT